MNGDVIARRVERNHLEAERLLSNGLNQHQIAALQKLIKLLIPATVLYINFHLAELLVKTLCPTSPVVLGHFLVKFGKN